MATCTTCQRHWTGHTECHCRLCHNHFSTPTNFDRHRPSRDGCGNPADLTDRHGQPRLVPSYGHNGITWTGPGRDQR
jgi:hypothetical protein